MKKNYITITEEAQRYFRQLLSEQAENNLGIRIFVDNPGTTQAECCMAFCAEGTQEPSDLIIQYHEFKVYIDRPSKPYLKGAVIDFSKTESSEKLTFRAPKIKEKATMDSFAEQYRQGLFKR